VVCEREGGKHLYGSCIHPCRGHVVPHDVGGFSWVVALPRRERVLLPKLHVAHVMRGLHGQRHRRLQYALGPAPAVTKPRCSGLPPHDTPRPTCAGTLEHWGRVVRSAVLWVRGMGAW
jgi:hypothetical protein